MSDVLVKFKPGEVDSATVEFLIDQNKRLLHRIYKLSEELDKYREGWWGWTLIQRMPPGTRLCRGTNGLWYATRQRRGTVRRKHAENALYRMLEVYGDKRDGDIK
jgi:hypothetical protein